jgi:anti-sigma B factor antagonist
MNILTKDQTIKIVTIQLRDRIDAFNAPELRAHVNELFSRGISRMIFDLSQVTFFDSAAMAVLVNALKRAKKLGGDVKLVWPTAETGQRILKLTKFDRVFDISETALQAQQGFGV